MFQRIVVPLDGSRLAEQALPPAIELARAFDSEVIVLGICEPGDRQEQQACQAYGESQLKKLRTDLAGSSATATVAVLSGHAADEVMKYAHTGRVSLIVMTSHGRSGIRPWHGGTAQQVLRKAAIPVIVVRPADADKPVRVFDRIVVPLDGSDRSAAVLPYVMELGKRLPCRVLPLRVTEPGKHVRTIGGIDYLRFDDRDIGTARQAATEYLERVCAGLYGGKSNVECSVRVGDAAHEILKFAKEKDCTLLAMSSHGHSGIERWATGSVTTKVIQHSNNSVFLVPSMSPAQVK